MIGSSQVKIEYKGEVWVYSGDYKRENDGISTPFELVKCHTFITECTFGIPAFSWKKQNEVIKEINQFKMPKRQQPGFPLRSDNPNAAIVYRTKKDRNMAISLRQQESW